MTERGGGTVRAKGWLLEHGQAAVLDVRQQHRVTGSYSARKSSLALMTSDGRKRKAGIYLQWRAPRVR